MNIIQKYGKSPRSLRAPCEGKIGISGKIASPFNACLVLYNIINIFSLVKRKDSLCN